MRSDVRAFVDLGLVLRPSETGQEDTVLDRLIAGVASCSIRSTASSWGSRTRRGSTRGSSRYEERVGWPIPMPASTAVLARTGLTLDDLRQILADDLRREAYLLDRFGPVAVDASRAGSSTIG